MQGLARRLTAEGKKIGLVPTMGFLHDGHMSLIRRAKRQSDVVITSIFINPTQFAPDDDLKKYPRDEKGDIKKIMQSGGEIVFIPDATEIYSSDFLTYITVEKITKILEGKFRPTHFRGVTTIVGKLFNITRPDLALFGMKDFQQAVVLGKMCDDLNYPVRIIIAPTIREKDGLAMSSRNKYFSPSGRKEANCLFIALKTARELVVKDNISNAATLRRAMKSKIKSICSSAEIEYIAFTEPETLREVRNIEKNTICLLAVKLHGVRLIDNMKLR